MILVLKLEEVKEIKGLLNAELHFVKINITDKVIVPLDLKC